jgi:ribonuclease P protein component
MLKKINRFHRRNHVAKVYKNGLSVRGRSVSLKYLHTEGLDNFRVAVVVSKKVSKSAVTRNRIRRRVSSIVEAQNNLSQDLEMVFTVYGKEVANMQYDSLREEITSLIQKTR